MNEKVGKIFERRNNKDGKKDKKEKVVEHQLLLTMDRIQRLILIPIIQLQFLDLEHS